MQPITYAYIDGANLHNGVRDQKWELDYARFRIWLQEKFQVSKAFLFIGQMAQNADLYKSLQEAGYILVFKPTIKDSNGKVKGNCDADMVLTIVSDAFEQKCSKALLVTSDGDFYSTVQFLQKRDSLARIISPSKNCSILLKRTGAAITYLHEVESHLVYKKKKSPAKTKLR